MTLLSCDFETYSSVELKGPKSRGIDVYANSPDTEVLLCAYRFDDGPLELWDHSCDGPFPRRLLDAFADPRVIKTAYNAAFEQNIIRHVLKAETPFEGWRCTQALAYSQSFVGSLGDVGDQMGVPIDKQKEKRGERLIRTFSKPQKPTTNQPRTRFDHTTHPAEWQEFREYCLADVVAEETIRDALSRFPIADSEWRLYELDQRINDAGLPLDLKFIHGAIALSDRRKAELHAEMKRETGLDNPNSGAQILPWLRARGYPFNDLQKDTVVKVLAENGETRVLAPDARAALLLRQDASRTSGSKLHTALKVVGSDGIARNNFQFAGASRTNRWAGRNIQVANMARTPKLIEKAVWLDACTDAIRDEDMGALELLVGEPMDALVGCTRSMIRAPEGYELRVVDLNAIEPRVGGWLAGCEPLLNVFRTGRDPYRDFGMTMYGKAYDAVTGKERNDSKPAVLGGIYRLGGGDLVEGKKTGLWGYAEKLGVTLTREQAHKAVAVLREKYVEIKDFWTTLENAAIACVRTGKERNAGEHLSFERRGPFLMMRLPSGRHIFYHEPKLVETYWAKHPKTKRVKSLGVDKARAERAKDKGWEVYPKINLSYMGRPQNAKGWVRILTHGGKNFEQACQATAREVLKESMLSAAADGFDIRYHNYDELGVLQRKDDTYHTVERLAEHMTKPLSWAPGLPLGAAGWAGPYYRKD